MNQAFDMRLDIKPAAPRPNKPAPNKADQSASDSDFHKTLENATASKQPQQNEPVQGEVSGMQKPAAKPEAQTEGGVMQEDTVDLTECSGYDGSGYDARNRYAGADGAGFRRTSTANGDCRCRRFGASGGS